MKEKGLPDFLQREVDALLAPALMRGLVEIDEHGEYCIPKITADTTVKDASSDTNNKANEVLEK